MDPISLAIGGAAGLFGDVINWFSQKDENKKNREWSEKMYHQQVKDQRQNWQMMVDYNAPSAQMERLASAGLSPYLVYGSGAVATANSQPGGASVPSNSQQAPKIDSSNLDMLGKYFALRSADLQTQGQQLTNEGLELENEEKATDIIRKKYELPYVKLNEDLRQNILMSQSQSASYQEAMDEIEYNIAREFGYEKAKKEVSKLDETIASIKEQIVNFGVQRKLTGQQIQNLLKDLQVKNATISYIQENTTLTAQQAEKAYYEMLLESNKVSSYWFDEALKLLNVPTERLAADYVLNNLGQGSFTGTMVKALNNAIQVGNRNYRRYDRKSTRNRGGRRR